MLEKFLQDELTAELKRLTRTEGQILVKLIYRETGTTAFDLVKELRNGFRAFTYNTIASFFDISLKTEYNPEKIKEFGLASKDFVRNEFNWEKVSELIENSIDANAKNIKVIIKDAGKQSVTVIDDGIGMTKEDAIKCFGRHSTSKLSKPEDLFKIKTMGFRGEALASIAAVSEIILKTKTESDNIGQQVLVKDSKIVL